MRVRSHVHQDFHRIPYQQQPRTVVTKVDDPSSIEQDAYCQQTVNQLINGTIGDYFALINDHDAITAFFRLIK